MFNKLLLAVDINAMEGAERLVQAAKLIASGDNAEIHVINVVPGSGMNMVGAAFEGDYNRSAKAGAEKALKDWTDDAFDGKAVLHVTEGTIYDSVLRMADKIGADVIVVGAHRPELRDYLVGPNAARITRHANQSVVVIR
ncbi:universal stress protein UspA [Roseovarius atlanticus]|uniref:Universal stress protein UspA n=1 Tax=Roseovarius atlanticus TaxID=1641875 RepID=A0A0T5NYT2_9RHOB|nr:universal stress protein [Roseovarius atlanticus]KRS14030.1 universal stress protein UspA [Roseovarius atlanticus]